MNYPVPETLSPSQLSLYMLCEKRWDFNYNQGLIPHGPDWLHFAKGSYIHELLHYYYALVASGEQVGSSILLDAVQARIMEDLQEQENPDLEFFQFAMRTMKAYVATRSPVIDSSIRMIEVERHLEVVTPERKFHGFVDLIYYDRAEKTWVIRDHKTGARDTYSPVGVHGNGQLMFYGALLYEIEGVVPQLEISWINSNPPKNPGKTQLWNIYRVAHTETEYQNYLEYLKEVDHRQRTTKPLTNRTACGNCPYHPICSSELKGISSDLIIRSRYGTKDSVRSEDSEEDAEGV